MKNRQIQRNQNTLIKQITLSLLCMFLYFLAGMAIYYLADWLYSLSYYQEYDNIYQLAQFLKRNFVLIFSLYLFAGFFAILYHFMKKPYQQMSELMNAAKSIYASDSDLPELSPDLQDFSAELAAIKLYLKENERAAKEAEQRKNDLVVYLAHDLKTPLTSVIGYLTLLHDEKEISPPLQSKYMNIALKKALRLENLINEFFDITRFNLTTLTLEPCEINLTMMLEQLFFEFQPILSEKNLTLQLDCPPRLMLICDPDKMQRVFDNLLRNAVNYSYPDTKIRILVQKDTDKLVLDFINHGQTIIPEKLSRIFDQFYRVDSSRSTQSGGSGLGLAISREIIELHGGTITAESHDEQIIFHITLF